MTDIQLILERIARIESLMLSIVDKQRVQSHYGTEEFAKIVKRSDFTVREWCRHGRLNAQKKRSGRGKYQSWMLSHEELLRYQRDGLLPLKKCVLCLPHLARGLNISPRGRSFADGIRDQEFSSRFAKG
jgi:hypothetical protein